MSVTLDDAEYVALRHRGLRLDLTRGKPSPQQLDLLAFPVKDDYRAADGTDCRNYGGLTGLPELREIFSGFLQVPAGQLSALGNSSLTLMHDIVAHALLFPLPGSSSGWVGDSAFLCPVPGYDRHFAVCEKFGIEMIQVPMLSDGPDMDAVEELVAGDSRITGMWCVPKYSNPTGACYSSATIERLARMRAAAGDFRLFWDNAYAVHYLTPDGPAQIAPVLVRAGRSPRPAVRVRFNVQDHLCGSRGRVLRVVARERCLVSRAPGEADHRAGQGQPAPPRAAAAFRRRCA